MEPLSIGIIGTGWCGGIRAIAAANSALVGPLHLAEVKPERLAEVAEQTGAVTATADWEELVVDPTIDALMISATPETLHYPMAKSALAPSRVVLSLHPRRFAHRLGHWGAPAGAPFFLSAAGPRRFSRRPSPCRAAP